ncbi:MAG: nuclear transport factor 2 family protein [Candidatus Nanopelagicales bacterium]
MTSDPQSVVRQFITAFAAGDADTMARVLDEDVRAHITNAEGGADLIEGRQALVERIGSVDYGAAELTLEITNSVSPAPDQVLVMVEVHAVAASGERLHNFAGHLCTVPADRITEWWMVEALPAESDRFWAAVTAQA